MVTPPEGAAPIRFTTFAVVDSPLVTLAGVKTTELTCAGRTWRYAMAMAPFTPLRLARMSTEVEVATPVVVMLKLGEAEAPAGTVTDAGTLAMAGFAVER